MTSKMRTLMFLLVACAFLLLVDYVVYLSPRYNSHRRSDAYSVRRGSKDHGSRWSGYDAAPASGTAAVPINRLNSSINERTMHAANHNYPNPLFLTLPHQIVDSVSSNDSAHVAQSGIRANNLNSNQQVNKKNSLLDKAAVVLNPPQSVKNSSNDSPPPSSGNILLAHKSDAKKPSAVKTKLTAGSIKNVQPKQSSRPKIRTEYLNPKMNCSVGKSRERMLNSFGTKFNSSLPAFVDAKFADIPNISKYPPPFGFQNSVPAVFELLRHLPETGLPKELQKKSCLRCIVVGNGGILKRSALGSVIDNFDVIIRMNDAPTRGFERDVGAKTTIRIFYPESAPKKEKDYDGKPWLFLMMAFKTPDLKWMQSMAKGDKLTSLKEFWKKPATKVPKQASEFRLLNAAIVSETAFDIIGLNPNNGKMKANVPTTGTISIMLGLRLCDEVAIAGFGYDLNAPKAPMHYYDSIKMGDMKKSWTHNIDLEKTMLLQLVRQGIITDLTGGIR